MNQLLFSDIKTVFQLLIDGKLTTTELIDTSLQKAKSLKKYNAFVTLTENKAIQKSRESVLRYTAKKPLSELDGFPIALKDNFCTSNIQTTCGSQMLKKFIPTYNATIFERLLSSGTILIGKTNLDQFSMGSGSVDSIFGPVKNHWGYVDDNDFYITGGSSGGSAISVATGTCFAAIGSDTGGSTRNPASYCGLVGLKPTYGLVSRYGLIPLVNSMDVPGILTRYVDDCVSILNCIAGFDPKDPTSLTKTYKKIRLPPVNKLNIKNLKIGIPYEYHCEHLSKDVLETWNDIANFLEHNGAKVKKVSMPHTEHSIVCYSILNQCEVASNMARYDGIEYGFRAKEDLSTEKLFATSRSSGFNEVVRNRILTGNYFLLTRNYEKYFNQALKVRRLISQDFDHVWEEVQLLLTPTTLSTAPLYSDFVQKTNRDQCALQDYCTQSANMAGTLNCRSNISITILTIIFTGVPAITLPIKLSDKGMPISLQIIGKNLSEPMLLALAKYIENAVQFIHRIDIDIKEYNCF